MKKVDITRSFATFFQKVLWLLNSDIKLKSQIVNFLLMDCVSDINTQTPLLFLICKNSVIQTVCRNTLLCSQEILLCRAKCLMTQTLSDLSFKLHYIKDWQFLFLKIYSQYGLETKLGRPLFNISKLLWNYIHLILILPLFATGNHLIFRFPEWKKESRIKLLFFIIFNIESVK
jgi:hypothetical protein